MSAHRWARALPLLAVLGSVTALGLGTSLAKQLFAQVGSLGSTALRVGFSALPMLLGLVAAVSSALPIWLEMLALQRLTPAAYGVMISLEPAVAALLG